MNAPANRAAPPRFQVPRLERSRQSSGGATLFAWLAALGLHAGVLFGIQRNSGVAVPVEFAVEAADSSVEVTLVAALPAEEPVQEIETPPEPEPEPPVVEPPPPEPVMEEPPPAPEKPPEIVSPEPEPPKPAATPRPKLEKPKTKPKTPTRPPRAVGDGSSAVPGNDATTAVRSSGAVSTKATYLRNPHPTYPEEARKARQEGTVVLRVSVGADGSPAAVRLARSSGFPLLDERARSTVAGQWRFKAARNAEGNPVASDVVIPVRFDLRR